jgi:phage-related protein
MLCFFFVGKRVILTHGFLKKSDNTPKGEILRAQIMRNDFFVRSKR